MRHSSVTLGGEDLNSEEAELNVSTYAADAEIGCLRQHRRVCETAAERPRGAKKIDMPSRCDGATQTRRKHRSGHDKRPQQRNITSKKPKACG